MFDNKYEKNSWIWPRIEDVESAKKAARYGMYACLFIASVTLLFLGLSTQGFNPLDLDIFALLDVAVFLLVAWRLYAMSRTAAVLGLAFYILSQVMMMMEFGFNFSVIPIMVILAFVNSIRGTFAFHEYTEQQAAEEAIEV